MQHTSHSRYNIIPPEIVVDVIFPADGINEVALVNETSLGDPAITVGAAEYAPAVVAYDGAAALAGAVCCISKCSDYISGSSSLLYSGKPSLSHMNLVELLAEGRSHPHSQPLWLSAPYSY